ncbi:MAG: pyridoxamine 5'-phosphate oxidase family protein [Clostridiales bacterium]|nr:pyridoxamine 5'-phosphate oxidase family protein [Clostridiales bacterium]
MDLQAQKIMEERFGCDALIALATAENNAPSVRTVNAFYESGAFYVITHAKSKKMRQIEKNPAVAVSGDWFTGHGLGQNLGHILTKENEEIAQKLRAAFSAWYGNGHVNEQDENTVILKIALTDGVLFSQGKRYDLQF